MKKISILKQLLLPTIVTTGVLASVFTIANSVQSTSLTNNERKTNATTDESVVQQPIIGKVCKGDKTLNLYRNKDDDEFQEKNLAPSYSKDEMENGVGSMWKESLLNNDGNEITLSTAGMFDEGDNENRLMFQQFYFPVNLPAHTSPFRISLDMNTNTVAKMNGHFLGQNFHSTAQLFNFGTDSTLEPLTYTSSFLPDDTYQVITKKDAFSVSTNTFLSEKFCWTDITTNKYDVMNTTFTLENNTDQPIIQNCYFGLSFFILGEDNWKNGSTGGEFIANYNITHSCIDHYDDVTKQVKFEIDSIHNQYQNCDGNEEKETSYFDSRTNTFYSDSCNGKYETTRQFTDGNYWSQPQIKDNIISTSQLEEDDESRRGIWITQKATVTLPAKTDNTFYLKENIKASGFINKCLKATLEGPGDSVIMEYGILPDVSIDKKEIDIKANTQEMFNVWFDDEKSDVENIQRIYDYGYTGSCTQYHFSATSDGLINIDYTNTQVPFIQLKNETDTSMQQAFYFTTFLSSWHVHNNSVLDFGLSADGNHQIQSASFTTTVKCDSKPIA